MTRLALIGDVHGAWDARDTVYFNGSDYDAVLFVGDLAPVTGGEDVAARIGALRCPGLVIPGNHDGCTALQLLAEMRQRPRAASRLSRGQEQRVAMIDEALGPVVLGGYSLHEIAGLSIIAARPHAMGGDRLYFAEYLRRRFDVGSMSQSARKLCHLVDRAAQQVVFLAHNGPSGLGEAPDAIWGCDFDPARGDFGDPDLRVAVDYADATGREVRAVVAGHMHHRVPGGFRQWCRVENGTWHLNAARVPRIEVTGQGHRRYHLRLEIDDAALRATEIWVGEDLRETLIPVQVPEKATS